MFKNFIGACVLALLAMCTATAPVTASSLQEITDSTVQLYKNGMSICSMTAVSDRTFHTANHCVVDNRATYAMIITKNDDEGEPVSSQIVRLKVTGHFPKWDTARLVISDPDYYGYIKPVDIATPYEVTHDLYPGAHVLAAGYAFGEHFTPAQGAFVLSKLPPKDVIPRATDEFYHITASITNGMSGGGLYLEVGENEYKLIGALSIFAPAYNQFNMASPWNAIRASLP